MTSTNKHALASRKEAPVAREQGMVSVDLYLKLADAMGYDSGKDGMEFSPEEWATALLKDALAHRATPSEALSPATVAQPVGVPAGWQIQPDEEGTRIVSPSGDECYLWDLDSLHEAAGQGYREVLRQLSQDLLFAAQPCASQGCGGAVRQALKQIIEADDAQALTQQLIDIGRAALSADKSGGA